MKGDAGSLDFTDRPSAPVSAHERWIASREPSGEAAASPCGGLSVLTGLVRALDVRRGRLTDSSVKERAGNPPFRLSPGRTYQRASVRIGAPAPVVVWPPL